MSSDFIGLHEGKWTKEPVAARMDGDRFVVEAREGSDFWENTFYGFCHRDGHAMLAPWDGTEAIEVSFDLSSFTELYDQAGLMLWYGEDQWIKAGVEVNDGVAHVGACRDGYVFGLVALSGARVGWTNCNNQSLLQ